MKANACHVGPSLFECPLHKIRRLQHSPPINDRQSAFLWQLVQPWFFFSHLSEYTSGIRNLSIDKIFCGLSKWSGRHGACIERRVVSSSVTRTAIPVQRTWSTPYRELIGKRNSGVKSSNTNNCYYGAFVANKLDTMLRSVIKGQGQNCSEGAKRREIVQLFPAKCSFQSPRKQTKQIRRTEIPG